MTYVGLSDPKGMYRGGGGMETPPYQGGHQAQSRPPPGPEQSYGDWQEQQQHSKDLPVWLQQPQQPLPPPLPQQQQQQRSGSHNTAEVPIWLREPQQPSGGGYGERKPAQPPGGAGYGSAIPAQQPPTYGRPPALQVPSYSDAPLPQQDQPYGQPRYGGGGVAQQELYGAPYHQQDAALGMPPHQHYGAPPRQQQYGAPSPQQYGGGPAATYESAQASPQRHQPHRDMPAAGGFRVPLTVDLPRHGKGVYASATHLQAGEAGLTTSPGAVPMTSPGGAHTRGIPSDGWKKNLDAVQAQQAGLTCAHNMRDGINKFEGMYSKAHAGKNSLSSFSEGYALTKGPYLDDALQHARQRGAGPLPGADDMLGPAAGIPGSGAAAPGAAPWQRDIHVGGGIRVMPGGSQMRDNVVNTNAGLSAPEAIIRGRGQQNGNGQGRAAQSSMVMSEQGISHNGSDKAMFPATASQFVSVSNVSKLVQGPQGLVEQGQSAYKAGPYAGLKGVSSLQSDGQGMHAPSAGYQPMARHAGKSSASNIVQGNNGISIMGQAQPQRLPAGGQGRWSTTYDDTYHNLQVGQLQLKQNVQQRQQGPDRF